jgi:pyruvate dehydrogenase E1 component
MIAPYVSGRFVSLGTDGFGRSDQRANLRDFFEVSRYHIALAAIEAMVQQALVPEKIHKEAVEKFNLPNSAAPWTA